MTVQFKQLFYGHPIQELNEVGYGRQLWPVNLAYLGLQKKLFIEASEGC